MLGKFLFVISAEMDIVGISTWTVLIAHFTFPTISLQVDGLNVSTSVGFLVRSVSTEQTTPVAISLLRHLLINGIVQSWKGWAVITFEIYFTDQISQKGGVGLCCLILCIFIAFLVFVTIPQISQEVPTVSICFASIWFLTSPLFALS